MDKKQREQLTEINTTLVEAVGALKGIVESINALDILNDAQNNLKAKEESIRKEVEKLQYLDGLKTKIEEERAAITKERETLAEYKAKLDKLDKNLKSKQERVNRILSD